MTAQHEKVVFDCMVFAQALINPAGQEFRRRFPALDILKPEQLLRRMR
jgi:hypothetical protein